MNRLRSKFLLSYVAILVLALGASSLLLDRYLRGRLLASLEQDLARSGRLVSALLSEGTVQKRAEEATLDDFCKRIRAETGYRVTIVSESGWVLGDSDEPSSSLENHLYRPEIQEALEKGWGSRVRYSHTVRDPLLYGALRVTGHGAPFVVRLALPVRRVEGEISAVRMTMAAWGLAGLGLAIPFVYLLSRFQSRRIVRLRDFVRDIRHGRPARRLYVGSGDELGELEAELDEVARTIARSGEDLSVERRRRGMILQALRDGIVLLDHQDRVLFLNASAAGIFQIDRDASRGRRLLEIARSEELYGLVQKARTGAPEEVSCELTLLCAPRRVFLASAVVLSEPGSLLSAGCLLVLRDISEQKRVEKIRADFVAHVSHELKTPLTLIKGFVETLVEEGMKEPEQAARYLAVIGENTDRLVRLVDALLRLSSIEMGRIPVQRQPVDVRATVEKAVRAFLPRAREKGVELVASVAEALPPVAADPDRLTEILVNLLDNAVKYTDRGTVRVWADLRVGTDLSSVSKPMVALRVSDTGIGIPARSLSRVTERFYRVERGREDEHRGSGLGLAIVKHLVRLLEGELTLSSEEHQGTTVTVLLPVWHGEGSKET